MKLRKCENCFKINIVFKISDEKCNIVKKFEDIGAFRNATRIIE